MVVRTYRAGSLKPVAVAALLLALVAALIAPLPSAAAAGGLERLQPSYLCPEEGQTVDRWAVYNPNDVAVPFTWELHKSSQSGAESAAPATYTFLTTEPIPGPNVLQVYVDGQLLRAIPATPACLALDVADTGTLRILSVLAHDSGPEFDTPAGEGVFVRVDGVDVGTSDDTSLVEVTLEPGSYDVESVIPSMARGFATVDVHAGETTDVTVRMDSGKAVIERAELELDELVNGGLSLATESITLRFVREGEFVPVSHLVEVELRTAAIEAQPTDLTPLFAVTGDGTVSPTDLAAVLLGLSSINSEVRLRVWAEDDEGFTYRETVRFVPGRAGVEIELEAPPSRPDLPLGDVSVHLRSGTLEETLTTDASGLAVWPDVPRGPLHVEAGTEFEGHVYTGLADVSVSGAIRVRLRLLGVDDVLAGVRPWFVGPALLSSSVPVTEHSGFAEAREAEAAGAPEFEAPVTGSSSHSVSIFAIAGSQNVPSGASASLDVPEGTESVTLAYLVATAEYPFWVLQQSIFDDTWRLTVRGGNGAVLETAGRNVNSQLYGPPVWNGGGSTGLLQVDIDVSALTVSGPASLTVSAHVTNISDSFLATAVGATLTTDRTLSIDEIENDQVPQLPGCRATVRHDHFSIPRPASSPGVPASSTNHLERWFDVKYTAPDDVEITNVAVELLNAGGGVLDTVVDAAPGSPSVEDAGDSMLRVRVTYHDRQSPIASTPPPTDRIRYRFVLTGTDGSGATLESDPKDSAPFFPLWRMPDGFGRYSTRDAGLDDWAARSTYQWLTTNQALVTRINDITGEHSRNICHQTHATGKDIDMFHVYTFPGGGGRGLDNYNALRDAARDALAGDADQLARLNDWATQTRARFDALLATGQVRRIYYAAGREIGDPGTVRQLERGWAEALLENGTYTNPAGETITLPAGGWANAGHANTTFNLGHNTHFHVALQ